MCCPTEILLKVTELKIVSVILIIPSIEYVNGVSYPEPTIQRFLLTMSFTLTSRFRDVCVFQSWVLNQQLVDWTMVP